MTKELLAKLERRVDALEVENRRWKIMSSGAVSALLMIVLMGAGITSSPEELRSKRIVLLDQSGHERGRLDASGLILRDETGLNRVEMVLDAGSPKLKLIDRDTRSGATLAVAPLSIGRPGEPQMRRAYAFLSLVDKENNSVGLSVVHPYGGRLEFMNEGVPRIQMSIGATDTPLLSFIDKNLNVIWKAP